MKTLRQLCVALVFTFALTTPVFGGIIDTPAAPPPPPQETTSGGIETGAPGEIQTGAPGTIDTPPSPTASATEVALSLLQSVLGLF